MYKALLRPILFRFPPETIHEGTLRLLAAAPYVPGLLGTIRALSAPTHERLRRQLCGLSFPSPVGLAAGMDKNAVAMHALGALGFGFLEIGTVTPRPQPGNERPRLFRLPADQAIVNRMGFNNDGAERVAERLRHRPRNLILGGNIGKNKDTPNEAAPQDYEQCFQQLYSLVDYFVVNVSSPNTPNLRQLQQKRPLTALLARLQDLNQQKPVPRPLFLKVAPDLTPEQLDDIVEIARATSLAGLIATNTTVARDGLRTPADQVADIGAGGLSGRPLRDRALAVLRHLRERARDDLAIIAAGGIMTPEDAVARLAAGADLVQLYTGFVYEGPGLIRGIHRAILERGE